MKKSTLSLLQKHEGWEHKPYKDTKGILTIGCGRNLEAIGLSSAEIEFLLENDVNSRIEALRVIFEDFDNLSENRQNALISMSFMGMRAFSGFAKMIAAIRRKDWTEAAKQVLDSKYHTDVGNRADEIAKLLEEG